MDLPSKKVRKVVPEEDRSMRGYLTMELIGTLWFMGALLARTENLDRLWVACLTVATFYYLRAFIKRFIVFGGQTDAKKNIDITVNVDADGLVSNSMREYSGPSRNHIG